MDSLLKRGLRRDKLHSALAEWMADQKFRAAGGEAGWIHMPGGLPEATAEIKRINTAIKEGAKAAGHILDDVWKTFRVSPQAMAAGTIIAGAGILAAGIGLFSSPSDFKEPPYPSSQAARATMGSPDVGMVGATGEAPVPGSRGGHVASRYEPEAVPRFRRGTFMNSKRFYYDQSNRTPRISTYSSASPEEASFAAAEMGDEIRRTSGGQMGSTVNVVNSPQARRYSRHEMRSRAREELYR
jgi:hypothetical protein